LKSHKFKECLELNNLELVYEVIVAGSKDNLTQDKIGNSIKVLRDNGAEFILVLRDLDDCIDISAARAKIISDLDIVKVVAVQAIESWFLADTATLMMILGSDFGYFNRPEDVSPFEKLKELRQQYVGRGIGDKKVFARIMISKGFSIQNAAAHPNCPSANYFLRKLQEIAVK